MRMMPFDRANGNACLRAPPTSPLRLTAAWSSASAVGALRSKPSLPVDMPVAFTVKLDAMSWSRPSAPGFSPTCMLVAHSSRWRGATGGGTSGNSSGPRRRPNRGRGRSALPCRTKMPRACERMRLNAASEGRKRVLRVETGVGRLEGIGTAVTLQ